MYPIDIVENTVLLNRPFYIRDFHFEGLDGRQTFSFDLRNATTRS
jgi:hypothetical protein